MSKYAPLGEYLARQKADRISLSFGEIEKILGFKLPSSAYRQRAWWSNNTNNNVMTKVWRRAEFLSRQVDMDRRKVVFQRKANPSPPAPRSEAEQAELHKRLQERIAGAKAAQNKPHHPLRGALKGALRIVGGTDLTAPARTWGKR